MPKKKGIPLWGDHRKRAKGTRSARLILGKLIGAWKKKDNDFELSFSVKSVI